MTVSGSTLKNSYTLDDSTTVFPYTFKITESSDMLVTLYNTTTSSGTTVSSSNYTVVGAGLDSGTRTVTYANAASYGSTYELILQSNAAYTQPTDYIEGDDFSEATHETSLDRQTILIKQLKELIDRCLKVDNSQTASVELPSGTEGYLFTDGSNWSVGTPTTTELDYNGTITHGADASKPASPTIGDIYFATDTNILYKCVSGGTWGYSIVIDDLTVGDDATVGGDLDVTGATTTASIDVDSSIVVTGVLDEDDMASDSAVKLATQQSIKAYADSVSTSVGAPGTYHVTAAGADTTTSTSYTDLDTMTITFTPSHADNPILILFTCEATNSALNALTSFIIDIDGNVASTKRSLSPRATEVANIAIQHYTTLAASSQTVKVEWKVASNTGTVNERALTVIEFKQN